MACGLVMGTPVVRRVEPLFYIIIYGGVVFGFRHYCSGDSTRAIVLIANCPACKSSYSFVWCLYPLLSHERYNQCQDSKNNRVSPKRAIRVRRVYARGKVAECIDAGVE